MTMPAVVRPRRLWLGVALAAAGMLVTGIGAVVPSTPTIVVGVVLLAVGLLVSWRNGIMADTGARSVAAEIEEVAEADVHVGDAPGDQAGSPEMRAGAAEQAHEVRDLLAAARTSRRDLRPGAATLIVASAVLLGFGGFFVGYPYDAVGQGNELRDVGLAVVLALAGLYLLLVGRNAVALALVVLAAAATLVGALVLPHREMGSVVIELVAGVVALSAAVAAGARRDDGGGG